MTNNLKNDLLSYWKLDETSGEVIDAHGTNNGTNDGATRGVTGKINDAFDFTSGKKVDLGDVDDFDFTGSFSIAGWVNLDSTDENNVLMGKHATFQDYDGWAFKIMGVDNGMRFHWGESGWKFVSSSACISLGEWAHVVFTFDDSKDEYKFYINGSVDASGSESIDISANSVNVGIGWEGSETHYFDGKIDEVGVWKRSFSSGDVEDLYNSGNGLSYDNFGTGGAPVSIAQSKSIYLNNETINTATINITQTGSGNYTPYLSADGGSNWEEVTSGTSHSFTNKGTDLKWKVTGSNVSITKIEVEY